MSFNLTEKEIRRRLVRLSNLEKLHAQAKQRIAKLETANKDLESHVTRQDELIERLLVRVEELETKMFGRKKKQRDDDQSEPSTAVGSTHDHVDSKKKPKPPRRPNPDEDEITAEPEPLTVDACKHCGGPLSEFEQVIRFIEDINIAALINKALKTVTKLTIERGKCQRCGKWTSPDDIELRGQTCTLGPNVKQVIPYAITVLDQSYQQVQHMLQDFFGLTVSDAEITRILAAKGVDWRPEYYRIDADIRGQPGNHLDETTWNIQEYAKHCYAWIKAGTRNMNVLFRLALSRGGDHAKQLLGDYRGVRITDGYVAYANILGDHQICWAHLIRKARELARLSSLPDNKHQHCRQWYGQLCLIYQTMEDCRTGPFNQSQRQQQAEELKQQIEELCQPHDLDPHKLKNLKNHMLDYQHALFTCLTHRGIPSDNNRAERDLRPLVIKRKKSFGSKTEKGAKALEVILSVIWSTWRRDRDNFWQYLQNLETSEKA
jgi:hypothetical protein